HRRWQPVLQSPRPPARRLRRDPRRDPARSRLRTRRESVATMQRLKTMLSWSSGKDSAWTLLKLQRDPSIEVVGLVTTMNEAFDRVAMHAVRAQLLRAQASAAGLALWEVPLPNPCSNLVYESLMRTMIARATAIGVEAFAFGD